MVPLEGLVEFGVPLEGPGGIFGVLRSFGATLEGPGEDFGVPFGAS